jgi:hypothetical protein
MSVPFFSMLSTSLDLKGPMAKARKPRELTETEKARFQVDPPHGSPAK